ncbi:MAG: alpha/beta hydrolase [Spirochaetales bacterium]|nr:alpha/beta hydrolase [Spirochaetales bacterium]
MKLEKKIQINGITTSVCQREGAGPAIICIHGNSLSQKIFDPLWGNTSLSRFPLVTFDFPGHGVSARPDQPEETYSMTGYAKFIELLLSELGISEVVLLGFSLGGHIAIEAAGNNIGSIVKGIFMIGSPPLEHLEDFSEAFLPLPEGASLFVETITRRQVEIIAANISDNEEEYPVFAAAIESSDPSTRKYLMQSIAAGGYHNEHEFLVKTKIPVMSVYGENDRMVNIAYLKDSRLEKLLMGRKKIISDSAHLPDWNTALAPELLSFMETSIV